MCAMEISTLHQQENSIRQQLQEIGLERLAAPILSRARPSLRLTVGQPSDQPVSRLGGRPNLPNEIPWPVRREMQPLSFIAQFDLAALSVIEGLPLPRSGSLFFFYDSAAMPAGYDPEEKSGAQVFYATGPLAANCVRDWPPGLSPEFQYEGFALSAAPELSLPAMDHEFVREYSATGEESTAYFEFAPLAYGEHRMGGNTVPMNGGDPRLEAQLVSHGIHCGFPEGYDEGRRLGLESGAADWLLLLQLDSGGDCAGMDWNEGGRIYFMVREDDLRRHNFQNTHLTLQWI
jgi:uncharacterized protein YwqG